MLYLLYVIVYVIVRFLTRPLVGRRGDASAKDLQILVLRHQLRVLRRKTGPPKFTPLTGCCWPPPLGAVRFDEALVPIPRGVGEAAARERGGGAGRITSRKALMRLPVESPRALSISCPDVRLGALKKPLA